MPNLPDTCEIILTAPDGEWLTHFTDLLVADRLCAAAHRFPAITATYWWQGELKRQVEHRASLHTRLDLADAIIGRTQQEHPYEVPGIAILPIIGGNPSYLDWIISETASPTL